MKIKRELIQVHRVPMSSNAGNPSCQNYDGSSHVDSHIGKWESYIYFPRMFHYLSQRFESSNVLQIGLK